MNPSDLGRLEKEDLHKYFNSESQDFTPWLATAENINLLGDAVGLELEVQAREKDVGDSKLISFARTQAPTIGWSSRISWSLRTTSI